MAWDSILAKDFCKSVRDGTHDTPKQMEMGYKLVTSKCIHDGFIFPEEAYFISEKDYRAINERSLVEQWDVLMSMIGNGLGRSAVVKQKPDYAIKNLALFKVGDEYKAKWLHYYLSSPVGQGLIYNSLQGSGQPFISLNLLRNFAIPNPPYEAIKKIVSVLELYDNLIENNQKQIKLLEEAAQRLYKQWFIDLRYPGHETTKIVDGLPEGWHYGSITEISTCYDSKRKPLSSKERDQQEKVYPYYGAASLMDYVEKFIFDGVYLLFGEDGTVITSDETPMLQYVWGKFWVNNHAHIFQGANGYSTEFLYMLCKHMKIKDIVTGVAQPKISQGRLNDKKIVIPSRTMVAKYSELTLAIFKQIRLLNDVVNASKEARDRLLPKLMNNEIEVG